MQTTLTLNSVKCDWITATSFDYRFYQFWAKRAEKVEGERRESKLMQYLGFEKAGVSGTTRVLVGRQNGREHYMVQVTGEAADAAMADVGRQYSQGFASVTRIDIQCTTRQPEGWVAKDLFNEVGKWKRVSYVESVDRASKKILATVGVGARASDRYVRVYTKMADSGPLLRFEVEFKGSRARAAMRYMVKLNTRMKDILLHEVLNTKSKILQRVFYVPIDSDSPVRVRVIGRTDAEKTNRWLVDSVLSTLVRQLSDHDSDGELWGAYFDALDRMCRHTGKGALYIDDEVYCE